MAIQIRRGASTDFDASKMVAGELGVATDGSHRLWATGQAGDSWELASKDDLDAEVEAREALAETVEAQGESLEWKADIDGTYDNLVVGNLLSDEMQTDSAPYLFRPTGGGLQRIGERCYPVLVGASVAENQLCNGESVTVPNGHKYYLKKSGTESLGASTGTAITGLTSGYDMVIDLTQMLGPAIADYVYSLEQATAGSGIAWLRSYGFLNGYKAYNAGSIESVEVTAKVVRDENNENAITYPLGNDVLRGLFNLNANNQLYADGDRKTANGLIVRRYAEITLNGSESGWSKSSSYPGSFYLNFNIAGIPLFAYSSYCMVADLVSVINVRDYTVGCVYCESISVNFWYPDKENTTLSEFKSWLATNPIHLVYKLATPTTEQSTPFTSPQIVYPDGTEEFITENNVPVGHETSYPYDLKGLVEGLIDVPDVPSANGTYALKATRSEDGITYTWVADSVASLASPLRSASPQTTTDDSQESEEVEDSTEEEGETR